MDSESSSGESQDTEDSPVLCRRATACSGVGVLQSAEPTSIGQPVSKVLAEAPDENSYDSDNCFFAWGIQRALVALHQNGSSSVLSPVHCWCSFSCHCLHHCLHFRIMCLLGVLSHLQLIHTSAFRLYQVHRSRCCHVASVQPIAVRAVSLEEACASGEGAISQIASMGNGV